MACLCLWYPLSCPSVGLCLRRHCWHLCSELWASPPTQILIVSVFIQIQLCKVPKTPAVCPLLQRVRLPQYAHCCSQNLVFSSNQSQKPEYLTLVLPFGSSFRSSQCCALPSTSNQILSTSCPLLYLFSPLLPLPQVRPSARYTWKVVHSVPD